MSTSSMPDEATSHVDASTSSLWTNPAWRLSFPAAVISRLGDFVFDTTVVLWIGTEIARGRSWAPAAVSGVLVAAALPVLFVGPIAGVICDRGDRHRILLWSNLVQAAAILSLLAVVPLAHELGVGGQLAWIYAVIVLTNASGQFFATARTVMIQHTIADSQLTSAVAVQGGANNVVMMIGPPLAAPVLFTAGVDWALLLDAVSFVLSAILLAAVPWDSAPPRSATESKFFASFVEGVVALRSSRLLMAIVFGITVATFGTGIINTLEVFFVTEVLHSRPGMLGVLNMGFAVGTIIGMACAPRLERSVGAPRVFLVGVCTVGLLTMAYSRSTTFGVAIVGYFLIAVPLGALNAVTGPLFMRAVAPQMLGRVISVLQILPTVASLLSMGITGWLASTVMRSVDFRFASSHFGPVDSLFMVAGLLMLAAGALVWRPVERASKVAVVTDEVR